VLALASAYGDGFLKAMETSAAAKGLKIVGVERYNVTDQSVTAQVAKLMALNPDAIYVASFGTAAAVPQIELASRGYKGRIYQLGGVANPEFLRVAGKAAEGMFITVPPLLVAEQLKESDPVRAGALAFVGSMKASSAPALARRLRLPHTMPIDSSRTPRRLRCARLSRGRRLSAARCAMAWSRPATCGQPPRSTRTPRPITLDLTSAARCWPWSKTGSGRCSTDR
jgi:hypothetical protein